MKESIGGTMMLYLVLFFVAIFIAFIACVVQYTRIYKITNTIINEIEETEGKYGEDNLTVQLFEQMLKDHNYSPTYGYDIECKSTDRNDSRKSFCNISLNAVFSVSFLKINLPVKGQTRFLANNLDFSSKIK